MPSLNLLVTSTVWRQDHNGFTHQDPGFLDVVTNKSSRVTRIYLTPDANCLLSMADHCLRSVDYVNVIVADKQSHLQYLDMDAAVRHCELAYRRANHENMHVHGYKEKGSIDTPLGLTIQNQADRFSLALDAIGRVPQLQESGGRVKEWLQNQIRENIAYAHEHGIDKPEIRDWKWPYTEPEARA